MSHAESLALPRPKHPPERLGRVSARGVLLWAVACACVLCLLGYAFHGKTGVEKTLTQLAFPIGFFWLLLCGWFVQSNVCRRWGAAKASAAVWLLYTLSGTPMLSDLCLWYLESQVEAHVFDDEAPLDVLVVLGGGTHDGPSRAQVGGAGDRVLYAAELYQAGHVRQLITTGSPLPGVKTRSPSEQTVEIWKKLGVPKEDIRSLEGINTFEELKSLSELLPELEAERVGLLTSAWHLPRALRLAEDAELQGLLPVAADYRYTPVVQRSFMDYLPSAGNFERLAMCQRELMAWLVRR